MFTNALTHKIQRKEELSSPQKGEQPTEEQVEVDEAAMNTGVTDESQSLNTSTDQDVKEKEKMLAGVRQFAVNMTTDIKDLLQNEWSS